MLTSAAAADKMSIVYALATPAAKSAICVFRVSGEGCLNKLSVLFGAADIPPRLFSIRPFYNSGVLVDTVGVLVFSGKKSYTGEDSFEVHAHGGLGVMSLIVEAFDSVGFEEAPPGEFTKRAFLNNKIDLNEAESVLDVIDSTRADDVYLSSRSLSGEFSNKVHGFASVINDLRMRVEGEIDFSDEGESFMDEKIISDLNFLVCDFELFLGGCRNKKNMSVKNKVVFVGPVNSGKSSTFNRLLGFERALISDIPGTTRDIIESEVFYSNLSFSLFDTAGIRNTDDSIEAMGIDYTKSEISNADVVVGVFDSPTDSSIDYFTSLVGDKGFIKVLNKIDINKSEFGDFDCLISAKTGEGFDGFKKKIVSFFDKSSDESATYLVRDRHIILFNDSIEALKKSLCILKSGEDLEIAAEELKISRSCLDIVVGEKTPDGLLGDIFSNFCIGK